MAKGDGENDASEAMAELERRTRDLLKAQQEAFLAAVRAWRQGACNTPSWPAADAPGLAPRPEELAEASYAFAAKLLADQSRFMEELSKTMATFDKQDDDKQD